VWISSGDFRMSRQRIGSSEVHNSFGLHRLMKMGYQARVGVGLTLGSWLGGSMNTGGRSSNEITISSALTVIVAGAIVEVVDVTIGRLGSLVFWAFGRGEAR